MAKNKRLTIYVFIDVANIWEVIKSKQRFIDYKKFVNYISEQYHATSVKVFYYEAYPEQGTRDYSLVPKHKFHRYLRKALDFIVKTKPLKRIDVRTDFGQVVQEKGNMDVELTIDAVHHADKYDQAILCTGDSDFLALVKHLQAKGKKIYAFSSKSSISRELRLNADVYVDMLRIKDDIWAKRLKYRSKK